ncbi:hypothetical protein NYA22BAC_01176 [Parasphingorhabdus sp. NYA22]
MAIQAFPLLQDRLAFCSEVTSASVMNGVYFWSHLIVLFASLTNVPR